MSTNPRMLLNNQTSYLEETSSTLKLHVHLSEYIVVLHPILYQNPNVVVFFVDMLHPFMEYNVYGHLDASLIITIYYYRI